MTRSRDEAETTGRRFARPRGEKSLSSLAERSVSCTSLEHDKELTSPAGDVIRQFLPADRPSLILVDELLNYVSRNRKSGLSAQLYSFVQNLAEEARARRTSCSSYPSLRPSSR